MHRTSSLQDMSRGHWNHAMPHAPRVVGPQVEGKVDSSDAWVDVQSGQSHDVLPNLTSDKICAVA